LSYLILRSDCIIVFCILLIDTVYMKIAFVAPFEEAVPPKKYGGTELVIYNIITELVKSGHEVTLFGTGDSNVPCKLEAIFPQSIRTIEPFTTDQKARDAVKYLGISKIVKVLQENDFDIVHNHAGWRFLLFADLIKQPIITTLHGPMGLEYQKVGWNAKPGLPFVSISDNQRKDYPTLNYVKTVYNGIDLSLFPHRGINIQPDNGKGEYLFFLGRMSPEKGAKEAIEAAKITGHKLIIAAKIDAVDKEYWEEVKPMIDGDRIEFIGEVTFEEKVLWLKNAKALLAPIQWEEPFGLFIIEAMACGTPALGMARGSFSEIIQNGRNGFLSKTVEEMAGQIEKVDSIDRVECRKSVEEKFTKEKMTEGYLEAYKMVVSGEVQN